MNSTNPTPQDKPQPNAVVGPEGGVDECSLPVEQTPAGKEKQEDVDHRSIVVPATRTQSTRSRSLHRNRSFADGYGFVCVSTKEEGRGNSPDGDVDREFVCGWDGEEDPENPRSMNKARKWLIVAVISSSSACVTCASSLYTSTYAQIQVEFNCSRLVAVLGLSLFVIGLGLGPLFIAPLSEFYGRRPIYIGSLVLFIIWLIPCALARNIQTMLVARFLDGVAGSAFLSVAGGTVGDLFIKSELQAPLSLYTLSPFIGPEVGPMIGGAINQFSHWRWSFYLLIIWSGLMLLSVVFLVPETYEPVLLQRKAERLRRETGNTKWRPPIEVADRSIAKTIMWSLIRPLQLLVLEPMCLNLCLFSALLLGILYLFFGAFPLVFQTNHGFQLHQVGLAFSGLLVGMVAGVATNPFWNWNYVRLIRKREAAGGEACSSEPGGRLPAAIGGAVLVSVGLFWFAWTLTPTIHWVVPIIGSAVFGMGTLLVFTGIFTFLVDAYPLYAASALAANSFARSSFAAAFPLFGNQMYSRLGYQWATSLLGFLSVVMMPFPYVLPWARRRLGRGRRTEESGDGGVLDQNSGN